MVVAASQPLLDPRALGELASVGGVSFALEVVELFLSDAPDRLARLDAAVAAGVLDEVRRLAHALRGGAEQVGAAGYAALALEAETAAGDGRSAAAAAAARELAARWGALRAELAAWQAARRAP